MRPVVKRDPRGFMIDRDGNAKLERNGKPSALNNNPRAVPILDDSGNMQYERNPRADRYPVLSNDDIVRLCFPDDLPSSASKSAHRQRLYNARQALQECRKLGTASSKRTSTHWTDWKVGEFCHRRAGAFTTVTNKRILKRWSA